MDNIGEVIRSHRERKKLSLRALGELAGVPWNTIARIERGKHAMPNWDVLLKIFSALGFDLKMKLVPKRAG